jgi:4-hydroxy-tetrahydrodipicolinate reductase
VVELALKAKKAYLCGTTGFTHDQMEYLREAAKEIKVFYSANMSVGIAILTRIAQEAIKAFQKYNLDPEINIIERHHKAKVDKPSGTAMTLANKIKNTTDLAPQDIVSLRYGTIIGEHELIISSELEVLSLKHQVMDRKVFAQGAIKAAKFLYKEDLPGFYTMEDLLKI